MGQLRIEWGLRDGTTVVQTMATSGVSALSAAAPAGTEWLTLTPVTGAVIYAVSSSAALTVSATTGRRLDVNKELRTLRAGPGSYVAAIEASAAASSSGSDSLGSPLPADFQTLPRTLTYNGSGLVATVARTDGTNTWTQTLAYTDGKVTSISAWVKS